MIAVNHRNRFWIPLFAMIILALSALPSSSAAKDQPKEKHCLVHLTPASEGKASSMRPGACFASLAESVAVATDGRVQVSASATADHVDQALRAAGTSGDVGTAASYVLSIEFLHINFQGSTYTFTGTTPCSASTYYYIDIFQSSWNDQISSSRGYSDCNRIGHWENTYRTGALLDCFGSCSSMGVMNDKTSSLDWLYQ